MRTTISLPDELYASAKELAGSRPFSEFASEALEVRVLELQRQRLARAMEEGYRSEAETPSLDPDWATVEVDAL